MQQQGGGGQQGSERGVDEECPWMLSEGVAPKEGREPVREAGGKRRAACVRRQRPGNQITQSAAMGVAGKKEAEPDSSSSTACVFNFFFFFFVKT